MKGGSPGCTKSGAEKGNSRQAFPHESSVEPRRSVDLRGGKEPMFAKSSTGAESSEQLRPHTGRLEPKCE